MKSAARLTAVGITIGVVLATLTTRLLENLLFGVQSSDPTTLVEVSSVIVVVTLLASIAPALRAARVDPLAALRYE